jgi:hypothetical protein
MLNTENPKQYVTMEQHWLILLITALAGLWALSLAAVRHWTRRQLLQEVARDEAQLEKEAFAPLFEIRPEDREALGIIRAYRRRYLLKLWPDTEFSFKLASDMSLDLIREIARAYHPEEDRPELKASLADLVALYNRVGERLAGWLETFPMRKFKDVEIETVFYYRDLYQDVKNHAVYRFIKGHHLDKVARWGWGVYNYANPWYWGRKAAYEGGKEMVARLVLGRIADLVGEEAMRVYGRARQ